MNRRPVRRLGSLLALALLGAAGCYAPTIADGQYACEVPDDCPTGFHCSCGLCISVTRPIQTTCSNALITGCTSGGKASLSDPGVDRIAFCPGAFQLPGVGAQSNCDRQPGPDGYADDGSGRRCAAVDNCAPGWHLCLDSDLAAVQLDRSACDGGHGFFLSGQNGVFLLGKMEARCAATGMSAIFGCGDAGEAATCDVLGKSMHGPCAAGFDCSAAAPATTVIRRQASDRGGVLCCH